MALLLLRTSKLKTGRRWRKGRVGAEEPVGGGLAGEVVVRACLKLGLVRHAAPAPAPEEPALTKKEKKELKEKEERDNNVKTLLVAEAADGSVRVSLQQDGRHHVLCVQRLGRPAPAHTLEQLEDALPEEDELEQQMLGRLREVLLAQQGVKSVSRVHATPAALGGLQRALCALVAHALRSRGDVLGVQLVVEPSRWEGEDVAHFPPPAELHAALSAALRAQLPVPVARTKEGGLLVHVEVGRQFGYVSWEMDERVPPRHFTALEAGAKVVLFSLGEVHLKHGHRQEMINEVARTVRYRLGALAPWSEPEGPFHFLVYPQDEAQLPLILQLVACTPGVQRAWIATRTPLTLQGLVEGAQGVLQGDWHSLNVSVKVPLFCPPPLPLPSSLQSWAREVFPSKNAVKLELSEALQAHFNRIVRREAANDRWLEVRLTPHNGWVMDQGLAGVGGLPTHPQQKVVALLSGGMDSPVAAYSLMKRGATVTLIHFANHLQQAGAVQDKIVRLAQQLSLYQDHLELLLVPFAPLQAAIVELVPSNERMLVYRRLMTKLAALVAQRKGAQFLVLGDSYSQVASQTVRNLEAIYSRAEVPILAPLIGANKEETIALARRIGTFDLSALPYGDCCSFLVDVHPALHMRGEKLRLDEYEALVDPALLEATLKAARRVMIRRTGGQVFTHESAPEAPLPALSTQQLQLLDEGLVCAPAEKKEGDEADEGEDGEDEKDHSKASSKQLLSPAPALVQAKANPPALPKSGQADAVQPSSAVSLPNLESEEVYLDHAASTPLDERVLQAMLPFLRTQAANPASPHPAGQRALAAVDTARRALAQAVGCLPSELIFTSGGTEANNLAIKGVLERALQKGGKAHVLVGYVSLISSAFLIAPEPRSMRLSSSPLLQWPRLSPLLR